MKYPFKYAFMAGFSPRLYVFAGILVLNLAFIVPALLGVLPVAALITGVSLCGTAIAVMAAFNIAGDISIIRSMFSAPGAVFYALTPVPRRKTLIANLTSMMVMDFVTMAVSIAGTSFLGLSIGSFYSGFSINHLISVSEFMPSNVFATIFIPLVFLLAGYLYIISIILFCVTINKSVFYSNRLKGLLTFLLVAGVLYISNIATFLLAPFGVVTRYYIYFNITIGHLGMCMYSLLLLILAVILFLLTARFMERKMNI